MLSEVGAPKALWCILYILLVLLFVLAKASLYLWFIAEDANQVITHNNIPHDEFSSSLVMITLPSYLFLKQS